MTTIWPNDASAEIGAFVMGLDVVLGSAVGYVVVFVFLVGHGGAFFKSGVDHWGDASR